MLMQLRLANMLVVPLFLVAAATSLLAPAAALAQGTSADKTGGFGLNATVGAITTEKGSVYDTTVTPEAIIGRIIKYILGFTGVAFFILMIYAGISWMTASGDQKKVTDARNTIIAAVIGVVIIAAAYALTSFVLNAVSGEKPATGDSGRNDSVMIAQL